MIVDCAIYEEGKRRDGHVDLEHAYDERHQPGKFVWIGLYEPTEEEFDSLRREFDLHPLAVEDAIHAHQRPKLEVYEGMLFIVLKTARYVDPTEVIELGEILVFLGDDFIITVRHGEASSLKPVRERSRERSQAPRGAGRARCSTRSSTAWSTTTSRRSRASRTTSTRWRRSSSQLGAATRRSASTGCSARCSSFRKATAPLVDPVARLARGQVRLTSTRRSTTTSATSTTT